MLSMKILLSISLVACLSIPQESVLQKRTTTQKSSRSVASTSTSPKPSPRAIGLRSASSKSVLQFEDPDVESRTNSQPEWKSMASIPSKYANDFNDQLTDQMLSQNRKSKMGDRFTDTSPQDSRITAEYLGNKTNVTTETRKEINNGDDIEINEDFPKDSANAGKMNPRQKLKNTVNTTSRKNGSQSALGNMDDSTRSLRKEAPDSNSNLVPLSSDEVKQTEEQLEKLYRGEGIPFDAPPDIKFRFESLGPPIYPTGQKPHQTVSASPTSRIRRQG